MEDCPQGPVVVYPSYHPQEKDAFTENDRKVVSVKPAAQEQALVSGFAFVQTVSLFV